MGRTPAVAAGSECKFLTAICRENDERAYRLYALTRRQHHERFDVQLCQGPSRCMARCDTRISVSSSTSRSAAGRPRKPWSNRAPLTSAIIAYASSA
jgi:hypothetical protein